MSKIKTKQIKDFVEKVEEIVADNAGGGGGTIDLSNHQVTSKDIIIQVNDVNEDNHIIKHEVRVDNDKYAKTTIDNYSVDSYAYEYDGENSNYSTITATAWQARMYAYSSEEGDSSDVEVEPSQVTVNSPLFRVEAPTQFNNFAEYTFDHGTNFTDRSLVDKAYVDNAVANSGGGSGSSGVTLTGKDTAKLLLNNGNIEGYSNHATLIYNNSTAGDSESKHISINDDFIEIAAKEDVDRNGAYTYSTMNKDSYRLSVVSDAGDGIILSNSTIDGHQSNTQLYSDSFSVFSGNYDNNVTNFLELHSSSGFSFYAADASHVEKTKIQISDTVATFTDSRNTKTGLEYKGDYSATFTNRSLVDKAYVDNAVANSSSGGGSGATYSAGSGIAIDGSNSISVDFSNLNVNEIYAEVQDDVYFVSTRDWNNYADIGIQNWGVYIGANDENSNSSEVNTYPDGIEFISSNTTTNEEVKLYLSNSTSGAYFKDTRAVKTGLEYATDYSATFTNRSLVDKGYVNTLLTSTTAAMTTQVNNLSAAFTTLQNNVESIPQIIVSPDFPTGNVPVGTILIRTNDV